MEVPTTSSLFKVKTLPISKQSPRQSAPATSVRPRRETGESHPHSTPLLLHYGTQIRLLTTKACNALHRRRLPPHAPPRRPQLERDELQHEYVGSSPPSTSLPCSVAPHSSTSSSPRRSIPFTVAGVRLWADDSVKRSRLANFYVIWKLHKKAMGLGGGVNKSAHTPGLTRPGGPPPSRSRLQVGSPTPSRPRVALRVAPPPTAPPP